MINIVMKTFLEFLNEMLYGFGTRNSPKHLVKAVKPAKPVMNVNPNPDIKKHGLNKR